MTQTAAALQTPSLAGPGNSDVATPDINIDGLLDKYLDAATDGGDDLDEVPGGDSGLQDDDDDTPAGTQDSDDEDEDTPGADEGDKEGTGTDEDEEEDLDEDLDADEDDELDALLEATDDAEEDDETPSPKGEADEDSFLPKFDRAKFLKKHPELETPYKHMQAAFTRKQMEARRAIDQANVKAQEAEQAVAAQRRFLDQLKDNDFFEDFLVQAALARPEVVEKAVEKVMALNEDEGKKKGFLREKDLEAREKKQREKEEREALQAHQARVQEVVGLTRRLAGKLGMESAADLEVAEQYVANKILSNKAANNGVPKITNEEIAMAVRQAHRAITRAREDARKGAGSAARKRNLDAAKARAKAPKRPPAPKGGGAPVGGKKNGKPDTPAARGPKKDPMDAFIDMRLQVDED